MTRFPSRAAARITLSCLAAAAAAAIGCTTTTTDETASPAGPPDLKLAPLSCDVEVDPAAPQPVVPYVRDGAWYVAIDAIPSNTNIRPLGDCAGIVQCAHFVATTTWTFDGVAVPIDPSSAADRTYLQPKLLASTTLELPIPLRGADITTVGAIHATVRVAMHDDFDSPYTLSSGGTSAAAEVDVLSHADGTAAAPTCP